MPNKYAAARRRHRDIDIERDLHALWHSERFENEATVDDALRVYEMAIRVEGWSTVTAWATRALTAGKILNAQLVELAMRALEQKDDAFFASITDHLIQNAPASYFQFWYALFAARHSHRGERLFRAQLATLSDYHLVKYRRWVKRIFRKLRFRCKTDKERAVGAMAFAMYGTYDSEKYPSPVFEAYLAAHRAAHTPALTKQAKPVAKVKQAELFAAAAAPLKMWSVAEGIRTSAKIPRTLRYLATMAPTMSDVELLRALKAFDAKLTTADHKKASQLVSETANQISARLGRMQLPLEEWAKILPYPKSPILQRLFDDIVGRQFDVAVQRVTGLPFTAIPIVGQGLDARAFRAAFLVAYALHRADPRAVEYLIGNDESITALGFTGSLWPYGLGLTPPAQRFEAEPDHPHRLGLDQIRQLFPTMAARAEPQAGSVAPCLLALRAHLYRRAQLDRAASAGDVPVLFLSAPPVDEERAALTACLGHFSAAALVLFERRWDEPLTGENLVHLNVPRAVEGATTALLAALADIDAKRAPFAARQPRVDQAVLELLLAPPPPVKSVTRVVS